MKYITILASSVAAFALTACGNADSKSPSSADAGAENLASVLPENLRDVSAATYSLEPAHAFLTFKVPHGNGVSYYRVTFTDYSATLDFDPAAPEAAQLSVSINPVGVQTNYPADYKAAHVDSIFESWNEDLARDEKWFNADTYAQISFVSTNVQRTDDDTGKITGNLTFLGRTSPITLDVTYNGSANAPWYGERDLIGFNASTTITRSEWGMGAYLPLIGDTVSVEFSGEFLQDQ